MIRRKKQKITSPYGRRGEIFHKGVDLRCHNFANWSKQPVVFPEKCEVIRLTYQHKWGWTVVVKTLSHSKTNYILKFTHLDDPRNNVKEGEIYGTDEIIGWTVVTEYMEINGFKEHLHFETRKDDLTERHFDPEIYFDDRGFSVWLKKIRTKKKTI